MNGLLELIKSIQRRPTVYPASSNLAVFSPSKQNKSKKQRISRSSESQRISRSQESQKNTRTQNTSQRITRSQTSKKQAIDTFRKRVATRKIQSFM